MQERAVLYARISLDKSGDEVGVTRQLHDMRQLAEARGYDVVAAVKRGRHQRQQGAAPTGLRASVEAGARRGRRPRHRVAVLPPHA